MQKSDLPSLSLVNLSCPSYPTPITNELMIELNGSTNFLLATLINLTYISKAFLNMVLFFTGNTFFCINHKDMCDLFILYYFEKIFEGMFQQYQRQIKEVFYLRHYCIDRNENGKKRSD